EDWEAISRVPRAPPAPPAPQPATPSARLGPAAPAAPAVAAEPRIKAKADPRAPEFLATQRIPVTPGAASPGRLAGVDPAWVTFLEGAGLDPQVLAGANPQSLAVAWQLMRALG